VRIRFVLPFLLASFSQVCAADAPAAYVIQTIAGNDSNGDGGPALSALFSQAEGIAVDKLGDIYVADAADNRVRKISPDGAIQTIAGTGAAGFSGDGGPAAAALLNQPYGLALDLLGNLYVADLGNARVRKISPDGTIHTVAGGGQTVPGGNVSAPALSVELLEPRNIAAGADGSFYISDFAANTVYRVSPTGILSTLAGNGNAGFSGDGSTAMLAQLRAPAGLATDAAGNVYIADSGNNRVREVSHGVISTVFSVAAPTGVAINDAGTLYIASPIYFGTQFKGIAGLTPCRDVALDASGNAYVTEDQFVRKLAPSGAISLVAGSGASRYFGGDDGPGIDARLHTPASVAVDGGTLYIADSANHRIRKISPAGNITTLAGTGGAGSNGDNGPAAAAQLKGPSGVAVDSMHNVYVADTGNNAIRKITPGGIISTVANQLNAPSYVALGSDQSLYVADTGNNRVVRISPSGDMRTVALTLAPAAVMVDPEGDVFISGPGKVVKLSAAGALTVVADALNTPRGLALAATGDLLIAETGANLIRRVSVSGALTVAAGTGVAGFSGDGGLATAAKLNAPQDLAIDANGTVWIADSGNNRVRNLTGVTAPATSSSGMSMVNAASMVPGAVAPGEIVTIFGSGFQPSQTQVLFDGAAAAVIYTGLNQVNALAPLQLSAASTTEISIVVNGLKIADWIAPVAAAAPGIFTAGNGTGQAAANNEDGTLNSPTNPARRGSIISLYATGQGTSSNGVTLTIGNYPAQLMYAGPAPGLPGLMQINAQIPGGFLAPGVQSVVLSAGGTSSQSGVTIAVQ